MIKYYILKEKSGKVSTALIYISLTLYMKSILIENGL